MPRTTANKSMRGVPFEERYQVVEGGCWPWLGALNIGGYGVCFQMGENVAHRVVYRKSGKTIPPGAFLLHTCDNPRCVNPAHLYPGDQFDNMADMSRRERTATTRLTAEIVKSILRDTRSTAVIARELGMSHGAISHIRHRRSWKHVTK